MCKGTLSDGSPCKLVPRSPDGYCILCALAKAVAPRGSG